MLRARQHKLRPSTSVKIRPAAKQTDPFYLSPEWRSFVDRLIEQRFGSKAVARCEDVACQQPNRWGIRVFADHVHEIRDGGDRLDARNILFRCGACHSRKTAAERGRRCKGEGG